MSIFKQELKQESAYEIAPNSVFYHHIQPLPWFCIYLAII